jgi:hypothetical protein
MQSAAIQGDSWLGFRVLGPPKPALPRWEVYRLQAFFFEHYITDSGCPSLHLNENTAGGLARPAAARRHCRSSRQPPLPPPTAVAAASSTAAQLLQLLPGDLGISSCGGGSVPVGRVRVGLTQRQLGTLNGNQALAALRSRLAGGFVRWWAGSQLGGKRGRRGLPQPMTRMLACACLQAAPEGRSRWQQQQRRSPGGRDSLPAACHLPCAARHKSAQGLPTSACRQALAAAAAVGATCSH